jgi:hypothetical protein
MVLFGRWPDRRMKAVIALAYSKVAPEGPPSTLLLAPLPERYESPLAVRPEQYPLLYLRPWILLRTLFMATKNEMMMLIFATAPRIRI